MVCRGDCREAKNSIGNVLDYLSDKTSISDLDDDPAYYYDELGNRINNVERDEWDRLIDDSDPWHNLYFNVDNIFIEWFNKNEIDPSDMQTYRDNLQIMLARQNCKIMQRQDILIKQNSAIIQRQETLIKVLKAQTRLIAIFAQFYIDTQRPD